VGMPVYVYRTTSSSTVSYDAELTYLSLEATSSGSGVSTFAATITIDSQGELSSGVTVYYSIDTSGSTDGSAPEETVLAPLDALCTYDDGYYLLIQADSRPENAIDPAQSGGSVTDYPDGYYAVPVEVGDYNGSYIQILSGAEEGATLFLRYQNAAPTGGDSTSDMEQEVQEGGSFPEGEMPGVDSFPGGGSFPGGSGGMSGMGNMSGGMNRGG
jgi:HlyD family secretion protein